MTDNIKDIFLEILESERSGDWEGAPFAEIRKMQIDKRGKVGEILVEKLIQMLGYKTESDDFTDRTEKHWDIRDKTNDIDIEVKTASRGATSKTFQYEGFERDRKYDAVILVGVAPDTVYLTCAKKAELPFRNANNLFTVNEKAMHRRGHGIQYKWTLSLKDVEEREIKTLDDFRKQYETLIK